MPDKPSKPNRKRLGFFDARDRFFHLGNAYRIRGFGGGTGELDTTSARFQRELAEIDTPEPDQELEDAELSDEERIAAMQRERLRRERDQ